MTLEQAVIASFHGEIKAFKPGNVSVYADGHNMTVSDFLRSAHVSSPLLCYHNWGLGQRIHAAAKATRATVGCNTNLGMLLLFAPLVMAAERGSNDKDNLRMNLRDVLSSLSMEDATELFAAIRLAEPGGLGKVEKYDVNEEPECSILKAMQLASSRDNVALQYANDFRHIFELGYVAINRFTKHYNSVELATIACYLDFMSKLRDSHIERKYGRQLAERIKKRSGIIRDRFIKHKNPELATDLLEEFDGQLKEDKINPGTSADLAAASLLVYNIVHNC